MWVFYIYYAKTLGNPGTVKDYFIIITRQMLAALQGEPEVHQLNRAPVYGLYNITKLYLAVQ